MPRFQAAVEPHCVTDSHDPSGTGYRISSVYFDSARLDFYHQKIDGVRHRSKLRFRWYGDEAERGFLEVKSKTRNTVDKVREALDLRDMMQWQREMARTGSDGALVAIAPEIAYLCRHHVLEPVVRISYERVALLAERERRVRITFDRQVEARRVLSPEWHVGPSRMIVSRRFAVLELKFDHAMPCWLLDVIRAFNLTPQRISKYCLGVDAACGPIMEVAGARNG